MPRVIDFTLTFPYFESTLNEPIRLPRVPVRFLNLEDRSQPADLNMLVDSGADVTSVSTDLIESLSIDVDLLEITEAGGVGGVTRGYRHESMPIVLGGVLVLCPVLFIPDLPLPLLGREGVFDRFCFAFEQHAWSIHVVESDAS